MHARFANVVIAALLTLSCVAAAAGKADPKSKAKDGGDDSPPEWVEPMKAVHQKFTGTPGSLALFGDSITVSMAFWAGLAHDRKNMDEATQQAFELVNGHMLKECWSEWRGPEFGNDGGQTMLWARDNVDAWLKKLNPETAVIMFGTNDLGGVSLEDYEKATRQVVQKCLDNGTVVILTTLPPRSGLFDRSKEFAEAVRKIARDMKVPLADYFDAIVTRRPDDWDGAAEKFKAEVDAAGGDVYAVTTPISADGVHPSNPRQYAGDYSEEGLKSNGFVLRNYVTLHAYADVIREVLKPK